LPTGAGTFGAPVISATSGFPSATISIADCPEPELVLQELNIIRSISPGNKNFFVMLIHLID
jgi:hypothetical protein